MLPIFICFAFREKRSVSVSVLVWVFGFWANQGGPVVGFPSCINGSDIYNQKKDHKVTTTPVVSCIMFRHL